jgi:uncharacterized protein (TIGR00304 family)
MKRGSRMDLKLLSAVGLALVLFGFAIAFVAIAVLVFSKVKNKRKVRGGGAVVIGPFPIVFGTDKELAKTLSLFSVLVIILLFILVVFPIVGLSE